MEWLDILSGRSVFTHMTGATGVVQRSAFALAFVERLSLPAKLFITLDRDRGTGAR